jgi:hypothetical protein
VRPLTARICACAAASISILTLFLHVDALWRPCGCSISCAGSAPPLASTQLVLWTRQSVRALAELAAIPRAHFIEGSAGRSCCRTLRTRPLARGPALPPASRGYWLARLPGAYGRRQRGWGQRPPSSAPEMAGKRVPLEESEPAQHTPRPATTTE